MIARIVRKKTPEDHDPIVPRRRIASTTRSMRWDAVYNKSQNSVGGDLRTTTKAADSRSDLSPPPNQINSIHQQWGTPHKRTVAHCAFFVLLWQVTDSTTRQQLLAAPRYTLLRIEQRQKEENSPSQRWGKETREVFSLHTHMQQRSHCAV